MGRGGRSSKAKKGLQRGAVTIRCPYLKLHEL